MEEQIRELIAVSRHYGSKREYVIAGGGNTSWKSSDRLTIKASGTSLATIGEEGFCVLDRAKLAEIAGMKFSRDPVEREEQVKNALLSSRVNPESGLRPSVETSLHDLFSYAFVVHTHPTLANGLLCGQEAGERVKQLFGDDALYIPYGDPGFILFTLIRDEILRYRKVKGRDPQLVMIQNHGVFAAADTIAEIHRIYDELEMVLTRTIGVLPGKEPLAPAPVFAEAVPAIRMMLSGEGLKVARAFNNQSVAPFIRDAASFASISRPFTPDQLVYCLSEYLFAENTESPEALIEEVKAGIGEYRRRKGSNPRVLFVKNAGVMVAGESAAELDSLEALVLDFTRIAGLADHFGGPHPMSHEQVVFIENWEVENYRKKVASGEKQGGRAENKVVVVTGAAQGFGAGIAGLLFHAGANLVIADLNEEKGAALAAELNDLGKQNRALFIKADVSDPASVEEMVCKSTLYFGGIDTMISNAGILKAGGLDEMTPATFDLMTRVNYHAYFYCAKYASRVMKLQHLHAPGHWMDIIQINSKSGLKGSNKNFAYAGGKFGGIGLTQSFALELMPYHIKVNAICPGNYFDGPLWSDPEKGLFVQYLQAGKIKGARTVEDVKRYYEEQVPAGRGCLPADVVTAILYVMEQAYETGQALPVTGGQQMIH